MLELSAEQLKYLLADMTLPHQNYEEKKRTETMDSQSPCLGEDQLSASCPPTSLDLRSCVRQTVQLLEYTAVADKGVKVQIFNALFLFHFFVYFLVFNCFFFLDHYFIC